MRDLECQQCRGHGWHEATLRDLAGRQGHSCGIPAIVPCMHPACRNGKVTPESMEEYYVKVCGLP